MKMSSPFDAAVRLATNASRLSAEASLAVPRKGAELRSRRDLRREGVEGGIVGSGRSVTSGSSSSEGS